MKQINYVPRKSPRPSSLKPVMEFCVPLARPELFSFEEESHQEDPSVSFGPMDDFVEQLYLLQQPVQSVHLSYFVDLEICERGLMP